MVLFSSMKDFLFHLKALFNFFPDFFGNGGKGLAKRVKANFKIYDAVNWQANNYNTHIAQYL